MTTAVRPLSRRAAGLCNLLLRDARPMILAAYSPDSCIMSTRVACEIADYLRVKMTPLVTRFAAMNKPMVDRVSIGQRPTPDNAEQWFKEDGSWSVGIVAAPPTNIGHVVAIVEGDHILDLSLDQASRPHRGIHLRPCVFPISEGFWTPDGCRFVSQSGTLIAYWAEPDNQNFRNSPDWLRLDKRENIVKSILGSAKKMGIGGI